MSDEPINHKLLARNKHRGGKSVDKNTSRGKYKKQEIEKKKKEREELAKREQDPNYQASKREYNNSGSDNDDDDDDDDQIEDDESGDDEQFVKHSRSKYSKRILVQKDNSKLVQLDEKYYNQNSMLNMQSLIDSKVDFIPKFNSNTSTTDLILDELNSDFNKKVNVNNNSTPSNTLNINEIEKMLSSFNISKRLNVDEYYLNSIKLPNPSNIVYLKRKSNKHLAAEPITSTTSTVSNSSNSTTSIIDKKKEDEELKKKKDQEEFNKIISSPIKDTANETPIDNGNITSDNLEDWLDSII